MQWKLSVREQDRKLTLPLRGETGGFIAKFQSPTYKDLPRVELATMSWAKLSGIDVPPIRLSQASAIEDLPEGIPTGDGAIYLIERFDRRPDGVRVHIEDFGQVLDRPADDHIYEARYEHIAAFLAYLPHEDLRAFCERLVFTILCGNTDAHVKNWSIIYPDGRRPRLRAGLRSGRLRALRAVWSGAPAGQLATASRMSLVESFRALSVVGSAPLRRRVRLGAADDGANAHGVERAGRGSRLPPRRARSPRSALEARPCWHTADERSSASRGAAWARSRGLVHPTARTPPRPDEQR